MVKVFGLLFVLVLLAPSATLACSCFFSSVEEQFEREFENAEAVFVGTAERVERFNESSPLEISGFERVEFSVFKSWKGPEAGDALFHTWTDTRCCVCGLSVKEGVHYVVFSNINAEGRYTLSMCSLTGPLEAAGEVI